MIHRHLVGLCLAVSACAFHSSGGDAGGGGSAEDGSGTAGATGATSGSQPTSGATGGSTAGDHGSADGTVGDAGTVTAATGETAATGAGETAATSAADGVDTTSGGAPVQHHLGNAAQTACEHHPLWCHAVDNVDFPLGDPVYGMECFVAPIAAPFELVAVHYSVAATHVDVDGFTLEIRHRDASGPTDLIASFDMDGGDITPNEHDIELPDAVMIDSDEFCIGFAVEADGPAGAFGMAVDTDASIDDVSFVRMGPGACNIPEWVDVIDAAPVPTGNWCIDATIQEL